MKNIALLNTSIFSFNRGDDIIMESAKKQLKPILKNNFVVEIPTHSPTFHLYEMLGKTNSFREKLDKIEWKFVCGTNLISKSMFSRKPLWNLNLLESKYLKNCILFGVGAGNIGDIDKYTKKLLKNVLSDKYIHSVRDEEAKQMLEKIGLRTINTGCPTLWSLTEEHCKKIEKQKSNKVVFTLTDYKKNEEKDQKLIDILNKNYKEIYFWVQGFGDYEYLKTLRNIENINIIGPSIEEYDEFLRNNKCDYVGTRLHAGIKSMQRYKRAIILIVDNRARSMQMDYNLNCIERNEIENKLESYINCEIETKVKINEKNIEIWKGQFLENENKKRNK